MKKAMICALIVLLCGCAYTREEIGDFVKDPHYTGYRQKLDSLEADYLNDVISYPVYLKRKKEIEEQYSKEVQQRENIIHETPDDSTHPMSYE